MRFRLHSIDLYDVRIPLRRSVPLSHGEAIDKRAILVRLHTSRSSGWGECSLPLAIPDANDAVDECWHALHDDLGPAVLALGEVEHDEIYDALVDRCQLPFALAGLDIAVWHAASLARACPLLGMFGGVSHPLASALRVGPCRDTEELLTDIRSHIGDGYRGVHVSIRPDWDLEPVAAIRQEWPDLPLIVDAGGGFTEADVETFRNLDKYQPIAIEDPLPSHASDGSAQIQRLLTTALCPDISTAGEAEIREIAAGGSARMVGVSPQRSGGLTPALRTALAARDHSLACRIRSLPELGVGTSAALHLAMLDAFAQPVDACTSAQWLADDVLEPPIVVDAGGYLHLPDGPGFGYRPSPEKIEKHTVRYETLTA